MKNSKEREEYLKGVAEDYGVPEETVFALASLLGETEDHDGLLTMLADEGWGE